MVGPTVVVTEQADDLARAVDPTCSGALDEQGIIEGGRGIIDRGEHIDWHVVALLVAHSSRQRTPLLAIPSRRTTAPTWSEEAFWMISMLFWGALAAAGYWYFLRCSRRGTHNI